MTFFTWRARRRAARLPRIAIARTLTDLRECLDPVFDRVCLAGALVPHAGIYRCTACRHEVAIAAGENFPGPSHQGHPPLMTIASWQLVVAVEPDTRDEDRSR